MTDSPGTAADRARGLLDEARDLAHSRRLWPAADLLMAGAAELGDAAGGAEVDPLGRPIRGSAPNLMDAAADWLELLDQLEAKAAGEGAAAPEPEAPPRQLRWAQWHALTGQAEIRRGRSGRAIDHLELAAGVLEAESLVAQALPLVIAIADCQLDTDDPVRAEVALHRARGLHRALAEADPDAARLRAGELDRLTRMIAARL